MTMNQWNALLDALPQTPDEPIRWDAITRTAYGAFAADLEKTPQNPRWHGEGNVWNHTRMVCEQLVTLPEYRAETLPHQQLLFLAALLHDIGKIPCTVLEDGTVDHSTAASGTAGLILANADHPDACWEFMRWWNSSETQIAYGQQIENVLGAAGRCNPANVSAMTNRQRNTTDHSCLPVSLMIHFIVDTSMSK